MNHRRFFMQLLLITLLTAVVLFFLHIFQPFTPYRVLSGIVLAFFSIMTAGIYFSASKAALSSDKNAFTRLVMIFSFVKMFLTILLVVIYHRMFAPGDNYFLIPFFLVYIVYTSFETALMSKLGKIKAK